MHCVVIFTCVSIHHYVSNAIVISKCIHAIVINVSLMHHKKKPQELSLKVMNTIHQVLAKKLLSELELGNDFKTKFSCDLDL